MGVAILTGMSIREVLYLPGRTTGGHLEWKERIPVSGVGSNYPQGFC